MAKWQDLAVRQGSYVLGEIDQLSASARARRLNTGIFMRRNPKRDSERLRFTLLEKLSFSIALFIAGAALLNAGGAVLEAYLQY